MVVRFCPQNFEPISILYHYLAMLTKYISAPFRSVPNLEPLSGLDCTCFSNRSPQYILHSLLRSVIYRGIHFYSSLEKCDKTSSRAGNCGANGGRERATRIVKESSSLERMDADGGTATLRNRYFKVLFPLMHTPHCTELHNSFFVWLRHLRNADQG